jgi:hypothetical protein
VLDNDAVYRDRLEGFVNVDNTAKSTHSNGIFRGLSTASSHRSPRAEARLPATAEELTRAHLLRARRESFRFTTATVTKSSPFVDPCDCRAYTAEHCLPAAFLTSVSAATNAHQLQPWTNSLPSKNAIASPRATIEASQNSRRTHWIHDLRPGAAQKKAGHYEGRTRDLGVSRMKAISTTL